MRFGCPSSSSQAVLGSQATASKKKQTRVKQPEGKKRCSARLKAREKKVEDAMKKTVKKAKVVSPPEWTINYIYVGNLAPGTSEPTLRSTFSKFGEIDRVTIRCSQGQYVTAAAVPRAALTKRDRHYATVEFVKPESAKRALRLNGSFIGHRRIIVTISVADLPEVKEIANQRIEAMRKKQGQPALSNTSRPLQRTDTEVFIDYREPASDRNHILGMSFGKGVI
ncbi:hypothetical protein CPB83DRAFT_843069 [Crepidotus variabilis]|uniref:RRM domain-containing protein n=1 Tax=Crepidotus variabilis TaxID=179855 RepID=A0A9P6ETX8_9AGAR|nr:hypothetical protein CPB83DRAFT_843069 [Crepidotus variabilis]